jgi:hypothetical protein
MNLNNLNLLKDLNKQKNQLNKKIQQHLVKYQNKEELYT